VGFVRERGQIFAETASVHEHGRWHDLRVLADHVQKKAPVKFTGAESLERNVELLATFRDAFAEALGPGYATARHDLSERRRIALGGQLGEWLKEHRND
jgi:hypothetical protein